jgi:hypothetical protein
MVDAVPDGLMVEAGCDRSTNREDKSSVEGYLEQFKDFPTLWAVGEVGCSGSSSELLSISKTSVHLIVDDDGATVWVTVAAQVGLGMALDHTVRLISHFDSVDPGTDRTLQVAIFKTLL